MKHNSKKVEIVIADRESKAKSLKLLREFSSSTISELSKRFEANEPIYTVELRPDEYYSGVSNLCSLLSKLDELKVKYLLLINGLDSSSNKITEIKDSVENMSLSDFR